MSVRPVLYVLAGVAAALLLAAPLASSDAYEAPKPTQVEDPDQTFHDLTFPVERVGLDGVLAYAPFRQSAMTAGRSPDVIRVRWSEPVEVLGVSVSIDSPDVLELVEVAVGRNWSEYGGNVNGAMIHVTTTYGDPIDERVRFDGKGFEVGAHEWVAITAWISNHSTVDELLHPETIIYFRPLGVVGP